MHRRSPARPQGENSKDRTGEYRADGRLGRRLGDLGNDPLSVYFDEIAEIPLLSREEEIEIAKEMESAASDVRAAATSTPLAASYVVELAERFSAGRITFPILFPAIADAADKAATREHASRFCRRARRIATLRNAYSRLDALTRPTAEKRRDRNRLRRKMSTTVAKCELATEHIERICRKLIEAYRSARKAAVRRSSHSRDIIRDVRKFTGLGITELGEVVDRIESGRQRAAAAKDRLVVANLRLVVAIAKQYRAGALTLGDLIQEGNFGLMRAAEGFDWRRGFKFSTYAKWWIRSFVFDCIENQSPVIRLPKHMRDTKSRIKQAALSLTETLGRTPSIDEIADLAGVPAAKVKVAIVCENESYSLDAPAGNDPDDAILADSIGDPCAGGLEDVAECSNAEGRIDCWIGALDAREAEILAMRHGLGGVEPSKLREIGDRFGVSRERVRQIENAALRRLRRANQLSSPPASAGSAVGKKPHRDR